MFAGMMTLLLRFTKSKTLPVVWLILILILLCIPGFTLPKSELLTGIEMDKFVHIFLFGMLVLFWNAHYAQKNPGIQFLINTFFMVFLLVAAWGIAMEFVQFYFIPNRDFDVADITADLIGSSLAYGFSNVYLLKK